MSDLSTALTVALPEFAVTTVVPAGGCWLVGDRDAFPPFRLLQAEGRSCLWHPDRVADIANDLDEAQPLLDRVERVSGWRFEPSELAEQRHEDIVRIADAATIVELALDGLDVPETLREAVARAPVRGDRPQPMTLTLDGPTLSVEAASELGVGDLLLLPPVVPVRFDGVTELQLALELPGGMLSGSQWPTRPATFGLRIGITLPPLLITPDAVGGLASQPLALGPFTAVPVSLSLGERAVGTGTLVQLGDAVAVRVETLSSGKAAA